MVVDYFAVIETEVGGGLGSDGKVANRRPAGQTTGPKLLEQASPQHIPRHYKQTHAKKRS